MKLRALWFAVAVAAALCGCANQEPVVTYSRPLISPGGEFEKLPPTVQNSVRAEAGSAPIQSIFKREHHGETIYEIDFSERDIFPPLYVASDGSVLTPNLAVAVGASKDTIEASTGTGTSTIKLDDLPPQVVETIRHSAPTAEVDSISRLTSQGDVFYDVTFRDGMRHRNLLIRDDGRLMQ
jgi:hypothetical protein